MPPSGGSWPSCAIEEGRADRPPLDDGRARPALGARAGGADVSRAPAASPRPRSGAGERAVAPRRRAPRARRDRSGRELRARDDEREHGLDLGPRSGDELGRAALTARSRRAASEIRAAPSCSRGADPRKNPSARTAQRPRTERRPGPRTRRGAHGRPEARETTPPPTTGRNLAASSFVLLPASGLRHEGPFISGGLHAWEARAGPARHAAAQPVQSGPSSSHPPPALHGFSK